MFPKVRKVLDKYNSADRNERYRYQAPIVMRYLKNKLYGWSISDFFEEVGTEKVALYTVTEFTEYVLLDLAQNENKKKVVCIGDKGYARYKQGIKGVTVVAPETVTDYYVQGKVDKIIICSISHANVIFDDFIKRGVKPEDIVTVTSAIFSYKIG